MFLFDCFWQIAEKTKGESLGGFCTWLRQVLGQKQVSTLSSGACYQNVPILKDLCGLCDENSLVSCSSPLNLLIELLHFRQPVPEHMNNP